MSEDLIAVPDTPSYGRDLPGESNVYVYIGHNRGVAVDFEGNHKRNEWVQLQGIVLQPSEQIKKVAYRGKDKDGAEFGSNSIVLFMDDMNRYVADMMILCEAMITNDKQQEAWKKLLRDKFWDWYNDIFNRYNLHLDSSDPEKLKVQ